MQNEDGWENIVIPNSELDGDDLTTKQIRIVFFFFALLRHSSVPQRASHKPPCSKDWMNSDCIIEMRIV